VVVGAAVDEYDMMVIDVAIVAVVVESIDPWISGHGYCSWPWQKSR